MLIKSIVFLFVFVCLHHCSLKWCGCVPMRRSIWAKPDGAMRNRIRYRWVIVYLTMWSPLPFLQEGLARATIDCRVTSLDSERQKTNKQTNTDILLQQMYNLTDHDYMVFLLWLTDGEIVRCLEWSARNLMSDRKPGFVGSRRDTTSGSWFWFNSHVSTLLKSFPLSNPNGRGFV